MITYSMHFYCVIIILNLYIFQIEEHNNEISPQPSASSVLANDDPSQTTSSDKSPPDSPQPSTSGIQSGSGRIGVFTEAKACI